MPRALKVCSTSGCTELVASGRCDQCKAKAEGARGTAAERGYDARWRRTRATHLRMSPLCLGTACLAPATEVDHIDGLGPRGPRGHDHGNLRSLCKGCHSRRTAHDQPGGWNSRG